MSPPWIVELDGAGVGVDRIGGKAAALDLLVRFGFPVPAATVVTTDAYRRFVQDAGLEPLVSDLLSAPLPEPDAIAAIDAQTEDAFLNAPLPQPVGAGLREATETLLRLGPVAVRSSATTEDGGAASFAGQHLSVLCVSTHEEAEIALRRCWASLWTVTARAYRMREAVTAIPSMAVILQTMVAADWSGVLFTRDPTGGRASMRIEAVAGLGDALVSGRVTPYVYGVDRETLQVEALGKADSLVFLEDLARIGLRAEAVADEPQDIEWAVGPDGIQVLQSRPITVLGGSSEFDDGFDSALDPADDYTPLGIGEMLPGPVPPLLWSINAPMVSEALRRMFADLGPVDAALLRPPLARTSGRAVLNLSVLRDVARASPGGSAAEVERQYVGRAVSAEDADDRPPRIRVRSVIRNWRARRRMADEVALFVEAADTLAMLCPDLSGLAMAGLLAFRSRIRDLAWRGYAAEVAAAGAAGASFRALEIVLGRWLEPEEAAEWAQRLTTGKLGEQAVGAERLHRLEAIYRHHVAVTPALAVALAAHPPERARARVMSLGDTGKEMLEDLDALLRSFGSRSIFAGRACEEDPDLAWDHLLRVARLGYLSSRGTTNAFEDLAAMVVSRPGWRRTRILTGQIVDVRVRWLRRLADDAIEHLVLRERAKSALLALGGVERRIILEMAGRLTASGSLTDPEDVMLLSDSELVSMLRGAGPVFRVDLERRRRVAGRQARSDPLADIFPGSAPRPSDLVETEGPTLTGWAASPGTVRGTVRLLSKVGDGAKLDAGEIIVAHSTDPSWTPLFLRAGGLVLEEGGPLSHAAIVAREFGIPAVLNVRNATRRLVDGEDIEVDGGAGTVARLGVAS